MKLIEILRCYLVHHDYDGFYHGHECHCHIDDLMPNMCDGRECLPGVVIGGHDDWIIGPEPEEK